MGGAERVVHVEVGERRELRRERRVVRLLARGRSAGSRAAARGPAHRPADADRLAQQLGAVRAADRRARDRRRGPGSPFGRPEVRADDHGGRRARAGGGASGATARMRASSATRPSSSGHVQVGAHEDPPPRDVAEVRQVAASRRRARRPSAIRSATPARVAPLVVVPRDDLDQVPVRPSSGRASNSERAGVADDVARDDRVLGVAEDALERRRSAAAAERRVDLVVCSSRGRPRR